MSEIAHVNKGGILLWEDRGLAYCCSPGISVDGAMSEPEISEFKFHLLLVVSLSFIVNFFYTLVQCYVPTDIAIREQAQNHKMY